MAVRYRVPVSDELLRQPDFWQPGDLAEGWRLISVDGPWLDHPQMTICTFEDDNAPCVLEGQLVEPTLTERRWPDGKVAMVTVTGRSVIPAGA